MSDVFQEVFSSLFDILSWSIFRIPLLIILSLLLVCVLLMCICWCVDMIKSLWRSNK